MFENAIRRVLFGLTLAAVSLGCSGDDDGGLGPEALRAAACTRVITPEVGVNHSDPIYLAGFSNDRQATGVHDDLWARGVVLEADGVRIGLVVLDVVGYFNNEVETIRALVDDPSFDAIVVSSTHNHEGPDTMGLWGPDQLTSGVDLAYLDFVNQQAADCLTEAAANLRPAEIRFATGDTIGASLAPEPDLVADGEILQHLCVGGAFDGSGQCVGGIEVLGDDGPIRNPTTPSFQIRDRDSREMLATLVNYASHPEALGSDNTLITSDFPHYMRVALEERFDGTAIYMSGDVGVLQGPLDVFLEDDAGEMVPRRSYEFAARMGNILAQRAGDALADSTTWLATPDVAVVQSGPFAVTVTNPYFDLLGAVGIFGRRPFSRPAPGEGEIASEMAAFRIGPATFAVTPNELDPQIGDLYRARMTGAEHRFIVGLGNDEVGYQMPEAKFNPGCFLCFQVNIGGADDGMCPGEMWNDCGTVFQNNIGPAVDPVFQGVMNDLLSELDR
jgi:hypothetical protein